MLKIRRRAKLTRDVRHTGRGGRPGLVQYKPKIRNWAKQETHLVRGTAQYHVKLGSVINAVRHATVLAKFHFQWTLSPLALILPVLLPNNLLKLDLLPLPPPPTKLGAPFSEFGTTSSNLTLPPPTSPTRPERFGRTPLEEELDSVLLREKKVPQRVSGE